MRCDVVEGEPGIFPEPVARVMRSIGGLFGGSRRRRSDDDDRAPAPEAGGSGEHGDADTPGTDGKP
jgi:hypothetical protein